jgi:outer membrane receptor protein involved in Fe transport
LWGANAVNGVINITTKSAKDTQGGLVSASYGTEDQPITTVRYGGELASNLYYRVYGKYSDHPGLESSTGSATADGSTSLLGGFRLDYEPATPRHYSHCKETITAARPGEKWTTVTLAPAAVRIINNRGG